MLPATKICFWGLLCLFICSVANMVLAAELPEGTIISRDNLDELINDTFEGYPIKSLLTEAMVYQIRRWNLTMKIKHSSPQLKDVRYERATEEFKGTTRYDHQKNECTGFIAGNPFPDISKDDQYIAEKLIWSNYYNVRPGYTQKVPHSWLLVDAEKGFERQIKSVWTRYFTKGRLDHYANGKSPVEDKRIFSKSLLLITYPYDLKGVGVFMVRHDSPKFSDIWVYIKTMRKTRRLSGGAWRDPIVGLDMLNDDIFVLNARPSWYKSYRLIDRRYVFCVPNDHAFNFDGDNKKDPEKAFYAVDLKNWPHWNPSNSVEWEPRELYVIECVPPARHPYSKRVVYMDTGNPVLYFADCYNKRGKLIKWVHYTFSTAKDPAGNFILPTPEGFYIDFIKRHASIHYVHQWFANLPDISSKDITLGKLREAGR